MEEKEFLAKYKERYNDVTTFEDLQNLYNEAVVDANDYGSSIRFCELMMNAMFKVVNKGEVGGFTGFQVGFLAWGLFRKYSGKPDTAILSMTDYSDLLYPQYDKKFEKTITKETWKSIQELAKSNVQKVESGDFDPHPSVYSRWLDVSKGIVPNNFEVVDE